MGDIAEMYREQEWEEDFAEDGLYDSLNPHSYAGDAEEAFEMFRLDWLRNQISHRERAKREKSRIWTQRDGTPIAIKDMTDTHLLAAARLLRRNGFIGPRTLAAYLGPGPTADMASLAFEQEQRQAFDAPVSPFVDFFDEEIKRRGLLMGGA